MFQEMKELLSQFEKMGIPSYDVLVKHERKEVFRQMYGYSDYEKKIPINGTETYNIYSCSKLITCAAAMLLFEKGAFSLSDKISDYFPEFSQMYYLKDGNPVKCKNQITIENLFSMSAGFTYDLNSESLMQARKDTDGKCPTLTVMKYLAKEPLLFEPGEKYNYSLCHDVIAALVELLSGMRFSQYVKKNIFDVIGMENSSFELTENLKKRLCAQYIFNPRRNAFEKLEPDTNWFRIGTEYDSGGAGCISTVEDYILFLEALRCDKLLKPETLSLMTQVKMTEKDGFGLKGYGYGLGVRCPMPGSEYTDFGWGGAAGAYLACDKVRNYTVYYSQHVISAPNGDLRRKVVDCSYVVFDRQAAEK